MRIGKQFLILGVVAAIAGAGFMLSRGEAEERGRRGGGETIVLVEPARAMGELREVRALGTGEAVRSVDLYPEAAGRVIERLFEPGGRVAAGDVLLRLDDEDQRLALEIAEVERAEAQRQVDRFRRLVGGAVSRAQLETAESALSAARLRVARAQADLADRAVVAPFDGVIGLSDVDVGDRVGPDDLIATLDDDSVLEVAFAAPERVAAGVRLGDLVTLAAWSRPDEPLEAEIAALGSRIDPAARTLELRARLDNRTKGLRPGASFEARIDIRGAAWPAVREVAVLWSRDGPYVWRLDDEDRARRVFGRVVQRRDGFVLMDAPLEAGDRIVVEGVQSLRPGAQTAPAAYAPDAPAEPTS